MNTSEPWPTDRAPKIQVMPRIAKKDSVARAPFFSSMTCCISSVWFGTLRFPTAFWEKIARITRTNTIMLIAMTRSTGAMKAQRVPCWVESQQYVSVLKSLHRMPAVMATMTAGTYSTTTENNQTLVLRGHRVAQDKRRRSSVLAGCARCRSQPQRPSRAGSHQST